MRRINDRHINLIHQGLVYGVVFKILSAACSAVLSFTCTFRSFWISDDRAQLINRHLHHRSLFSFQKSSTVLNRYRSEADPLPFMLWSHELHNHILSYAWYKRESPSIKVSFGVVDVTQTVIWLVLPLTGVSRCPPLGLDSQWGSIQPRPGFLHQSGIVSSFGEERPNGKKCTTPSPPPRAAIMEHPWSLMERTSQLKSPYSVSVIIHGHHFLRI